jgi:hypothetical protein
MRSMRIPIRILVILCHHKKLDFYMKNRLFVGKYCEKSHLKGWKLGLGLFLI